MRVLKKINVYLILLVVSALVAGVYGSLHDQISYTFSNEYFTRFKFIQFNIPWAYDYPRLGAAYVGALGTWWMGLIIFLILGIFGFIFESPREMALNLGKSFLVVVSIALLTSFLGLLVGYYEIDKTTVASYMIWVRPGVVDPIQFVRVGFMHNASYLGGLIGLISGVVYLMILKYRSNKPLQPSISEKI